MDRYGHIDAAKGRAMNDSHERRLLYIAWFCWAAPAAVGVGSTLLYALTDNELFVMSGMLCVPAGIILFLFGVTTLANINTGPRGLILALLLSNFPLAFVCAVVGMGKASIIGGPYLLEVHVANRSGVFIDSAAATYGASSGTTSGIPPNETGSIRLRVPYESRQTPITVFVVSGGKSLSKEMMTMDGDDFLGSRKEELTVEVTRDGIDWPKHSK
jgi:hypothetical protein